MTSDFSSSQHINLKYIADQNISKPFPWVLSFILIFCLVIAGFGLWLFANRNQPEYIVHQIQPGDTLQSLAKQYYQDINLWKIIFLANRKKLINQKPLIPGEKILIPKDIITAKNNKPNTQNITNQTSQTTNKTPQTTNQTSQNINNSSRLTTTNNSQQIPKQ